MRWLLLIVGTLLVVECFLRLPLGNRSVRGIGIAKKISRTIRSRAISDHWKERVLLAYAGQLLATSVQLFAIFCLAIAPMIVISLGADAAGLDFSRLLMTARAISLSTLFAAAYVAARSRFT